MTPLNVTITRGLSDMTGTPGSWVTHELGWACNTLELPWHDNARGLSCIMADSYAASLFKSGNLGDGEHDIVETDDQGTIDIFHTVYRLEDKHGREACEVHNGNFAGHAPSGQFTQVHGCTLVGRGYGNLKRPDADKMQWGILRSLATLKELIAVHKGHPLVITYEWAPGCNPEEA